MDRTPWRWVWSTLLRVVALVGALGLALSSAYAGDPSSTLRFQSAVPTKNTSTRTLTLQPSRDGFVGEIALTNSSDAPLTVARVAMRGDLAEPRVPPKVVVRVLDGALPLTLAPGASRTIQVRWVPEFGGKLRQLCGHLVASTTEDTAEEVTIGVRAQSPGPLGPLERHLVSAALFVPLCAVLVMVALRLSHRHKTLTPYRLAVGSLAAQTMIVSYMCARYTCEVRRSDGNDGLQFIEHGVLAPGFGLEIFFGVDGLCMGSIATISVLALMSIVMERKKMQESTMYCASYLVLTASVMAALCAMDAALLVFFVTLSVMAGATVLWGWGDTAMSTGTHRLAHLGAFACVALAAAVYLVSTHAGSSTLVDGTPTNVTFNLPELARMNSEAVRAGPLGWGGSRVAYGLVLCAGAFFLGAFPMHTWVTPALEVVPVSAGIVTSAAFPAIGLCILLRVGTAVLHGGAQWAAGAVVALGAVSALYGSILASRRSGLVERLGPTGAMHAGLVLMGIGAMSIHGIAGATCVIVCRMIPGAATLLCAKYNYVARSDGVRLSRRQEQQLRFARRAVHVVVSLSQGGLAGGCLAWGALTILFASPKTHVAFVVMAATALVIVSAGYLNQDFWSDPPDASCKEASAAAQGPSGEARARWRRRGIAALTLTMGVLAAWPVPLFAVALGTAKDLAMSFERHSGPDTPR